jgi:hypothetical protein
MSAAVTGYRRDLKKCQSNFDDYDDALTYAKKLAKEHGITLGIPGDQRSADGSHKIRIKKRGGPRSKETKFDVILYVLRGHIEEEKIDPIVDASSPVDDSQDRKKMKKKRLGKKERKKLLREESFSE